MSRGRCVLGPCEKCGSKDNRGRYPDGSEWCFGCHDYTPPLSQTINKVKQLSDGFKNNLLRSHNGVELPRDCSKYIPAEPLSWLKRYGMTNEEIENNNFLWSSDTNQLIFPVLDSESNIMFYQGRFFPKQKQKYNTSGNSEDVLVFFGDNTGDDIVLCEDVVSAIKVGRQCSAQPIFGSYISLKRAKRLSKRFKRMVVWLDMDKAKESLKMALKFAYMFEQSPKVIATEKDPKELSDQEIKKHLTN